MEYRDYLEAVLAVLERDRLFRALIVSIPPEGIAFCINTVSHEVFSVGQTPEVAAEILSSALSKVALEMIKIPGRPS